MSYYHISNDNMGGENADFDFYIKFKGIEDGSATERLWLENMLGNAWLIKKVRP